MDDRQLMFLDTASLYFRAFFGIPGTLRADNGTPINAVHGLLDMLTRLITQYSPTGVVCAWDNDWRPGWRVDLIPSYKAHRLLPEPMPGAIVGAGGIGAVSGQQEITDADLVVQVPIIVAALAAVGLSVQGHDGFEADDVLASLVAAATRADQRSLVVTGDRDLFQLVDEHCRVIYLGRGVAKHDVVDDAWLAGKYSIIGAQYADFATLRSDASDGLPGVSGIGEKTAEALLDKHGDLAGILAAASDPHSGMAARLRVALASNIDYLARAGEVVRCVSELNVDVDVALDSVRVDEEACRRLAECWQLGGAINRLLVAIGHPTLDLNA